MERRLALWLGGILLAAAARADESEPATNPYQVIVERNAFGLRPMPTITALPPTNKLDQLSVKLSGITSDKKSGKKAWLIIPAPPNKNTNPQYLSIPEHEKQGDIEVVEINEKENTVKILLAGAPWSSISRTTACPRRRRRWFRELAIRRTDCPRRFRARRRSSRLQERHLRPLRQPRPWRCGLVCNRRHPTLRG